MKSLRRSINKDPPAIATPGINTHPALSKQNAHTPNVAKTVRCIQQYRAKSPQELSCAIGDILYVVRDTIGWYEVTNPSSNSRGVVPKSCLEEMSSSSGPNSIQAGPTARVPPPQMTPRVQSMAGKSQTRHQTFYAIVQYDFSAERPDELDAKAGEPISVVAQSNREWFVAKPIGRLGGPGLIPVSFVEIRDPATNLPVKDVEGLMERGVLPRVEEWKQATAEYKASSIPLGVLDDLSTNGAVVTDSPFMKQNQQRQVQQPPINSSPITQVQQQTAIRQSQQHERSQSYATSQLQTAVSHSRTQSRADSTRTIPPPPPPKQQIQEPRLEEPVVDMSSSDLLPPGTVLSASIPSFHYENDEYWFRIDAMYQANNTASTSTAPRVLQLILYRNYDDFYEFQISLLDAFPSEAGRGPDDSTRILPYMPGPVSYVDDMITSVRRTELDQYLGELCEMEQKGSGHILRHDLVRSFLSPKSGDVVDEVEVSDDWVLGTMNNGNGNGHYHHAGQSDTIEEDQQPPRRSYVDDVANDLDRTHLQPGVSHTNATARSSNGGSGYGEERTPQDQFSVAGGRHTPAESFGRRSESRSRSPIKNANHHGLNEERNGDHSRPNSQFQQDQQPLTPYSATSDYSSSHPKGGHSHSQSHSTLSPPSASGPSYAGYGGGGSAAPSRSARSSGNTQSDVAGMPAYNNHNGPQPPSQQASARSSHHQSEGNHSDAGPGTRTSASNPSGSAPPFLKIKIFHSESDDLIAIRVPPRVTFTQLINKVRDRLGPGVTVLRYRDSYDGNGGGGGAAAKNWREIVGDEDLRDWISKGDKLVLYAD
ncbi:bud emergence protein 1 [Tulasnella sp. 331]|nr:bud emergence protein 1 [Tulasnella sp. 331]